LVQAKVPTLLEIHDPPSGPRRRFVQQVAHRPALRGIIALTDACRQVLTSFEVPVSKMIVVGSCVDPGPYEALPSRAECRQSLELPLDRQIIGYVGRFEALGSHKGLSTLVEAAGVLRRQGLSPFVLCVGGPMSAVPDLIETARAFGMCMDDLRFVDHVSSVEVPKWIRACDVGVLPSTRTEHLAQFSSPLKVFEFMAAGVPLVAADLPAVREILAHDESAWLVEPEDASALAHGLARLLQSSALRERLGERAKSDVRAHTWTRRATTITAQFMKREVDHSDDLRE
jgi:glycosyltransferase involved in cell wall biosynthesis